MAAKSEISHKESAAISSDFTRADYGCIGADDRLSAEEMDEMRDKATAYEYLCHLEEAKQWMEFCLKDELPPSIELEEGLRNGVYLGKLAHFFAPDTITLRKIYDKDMKRYEQRGLHFKHTDNINHFFTAMSKVGLPSIFYPETTDIYDRKNMPKTIYCIHALSLYLFKLGKAPQMKDLYGIAKFTEEELSNMRKELDKYGIQMPQFNKIGGILANELSVDEATLHAAVIAINEALEAGDVENTMKALRNPNACLNTIEDGNDEEYQNRLLAAKKLKIEAAHNKSLQQPDEERDMYEELLNHTDLQGNINKINLSVKLENLHREMDADNKESVLRCLNALNISNIEPANISLYAEQLKKAVEEKRQRTGDPSSQLDRNEVQSVINEANLLASKKKQMEDVIRHINSLLVDDASADELIDQLKKPEAELPPVCADYPVVHQKELFKARISKEQDLSRDEVGASLPFLNALASFNSSLGSGDNDVIWAALCEPQLGVERLKDENKLRTCETLKASKRDVEYLSLVDIQAAVDNVNNEVEQEQEKQDAIKNVNDAFFADDKDALLAALKHPSLNLCNIEPDNVFHYIRVMKRRRQEKGVTSENIMLFVDDLQLCIDTGNLQTKQALKQISAVTAVNIALEDDNCDPTYELLQHTDMGLTSLEDECGPTYHEQLKELRCEKLSKGCTDATWVSYVTDQNDTFYFNTETLDGSWEKPDDFNPDPAQLSKNEIQECVGMVTEAYNRAQMWKDRESFVVKLQAFTRMHIAKKNFQERKEYLNDQTPAALTLQAVWRGYSQKKKYNERLNYFNDNVDHVVTMQKWVRMWQARNKYRARLQYFRDNVNTIVRLQAWFRSNKARHDYMTLTGVENPPLPVVQKFVHLLDQRANDFAEEMELQELKKTVVQSIKSNNDLEQALNTMDIKIGLLVKNRITLQDVINHSKNLKKTAKEAANQENANQAAGLKSLNKTNRARLEAYQHLFYLLQTNPTYLGKLIFKISAGKTTNFMESVILSVYNYASNQREEYLLLKLYKTALQEEIESKVDQIKEIATGNPLVIKMVVTFNRGAKGQSSLRNILAPQVQSVMTNKSLTINMSPVEIYKAWISQKETETGEASDLPYDVSTEQAMEHEEVRKRVEDSVNQLRTVTEGFLKAIVASTEQIPYGLRYIAKNLRNLLAKKFPDADEDELIKMAGNLIYYRFMNPAIVAPDGFDIIDMSARGTGLNNDQRRNLASIAKVLQFASTGKTFTGDTEHLTGINSYLVEAYQRFKKFFLSVCDVPDLEEKYNMDEYSDAVLLVKPVIFISLKEILDTHRLLLEHANEIAPENDPLHDTLAELGDIPDVATLIGNNIQRQSKRVSGDNSTASEPDNDQLDSVLNTEVSLTLASKVEIKEDDDSDIKNLLLRTKRMIIDIIRVQPGENLNEVLDTPATESQEEEHMKNVEKLEEQKRKEQEETKSEDESMLRTRSLLNENKLPLEDMKKRVKRNLEKLESHDVVSSKDNYQTIVNLIARDIRNQRRYRLRRKQELTKLKQNMDRLDQKSKFFEEQSDYYRTYIKSCLESLANKSNKKSVKKKKKRPAIKYTAAELQRKKILIQIEGIDNEKLRSVMFELSQSDDDVGKFDINAKVLGMNMDKVTIVFQDLLQLQYEGVSVMKLNVSDYQAKINVNLLIFLLNKKFYGK